MKLFLWRKYFSKKNNGTKNFLIRKFGKENLRKMTVKKNFSIFFIRKISVKKIFVRKITVRKNYLYNKFW